jgi:hypothetical protein
MKKKGFARRFLFYSLEQHFTVPGTIFLATYLPVQQPGKKLSGACRVNAFGLKRKVFLAYHNSE